MSQTRQVPIYWIIVFALLGCCMELDISIPSFPKMKDYFGVSASAIQMTLSANFAGFCLAGLLYGPLSDVYGRRSGMVVGATLFMLSAIACIMAPNIETLIACRFIQGIGAASPGVIGFAILADVYHGDEAMRYIGRVNGLVTAFMASAPIIGGLLGSLGDWRINFTFIAFLACIAWLIVITLLPETKPNRSQLSFRRIVGEYLTLIKSRRFLCYAMVPNVLCVAYLTYLGSTAFYYQETCGLSVIAFSLHEGAVVLTFSLISFYAGKIIDRLGSARAALVGVLICAISSTCLIVLTHLWPTQYYWVTLWMCVFGIGAALPFSVTFTESIELFPELKGAAASFIMASRLLLSAAMVWLSGVYFDGTMQPVAWIILLAAWIGGLMSLWLYKAEVF